MTPDNIKQGFSATGLVPASLAEPHLSILQESDIDSLEGYDYALNPDNMDLLPDRLTPPSEILARNATPLEVTPDLVPISALDSPPPPFLPLLNHLRVLMLKRLLPWVQSTPFSIFFILKSWYSTPFQLRTHLLVHFPGSSTS